MVPIASLRPLLRDASVSPDAGGPLVVGGARALATALRRELGVAGGDDPGGASVYVHVWAGDGDDEEQLRHARRARVPIVALAPPEVDAVPFVLATDIVPLPPGAGFPVEALAEAIAGRLGEEAAPLAARVPALRRAVARRLVESFARRNGIIAAAVTASGVEQPVLLRNELRLVLRLAQACGRETDLRSRLPELGGAVAFGLGLRALARELLELQLLPRRAVQGGVAYAGTRALGEAALRRLVVARGPGGHAVTRRRGGASPAAP